LTDLGQVEKKNLNYEEKVNQLFVFLL